MRIFINLMMNGLGVMLCVWSLSDMLLSLHIGTPPSFFSPNLSSGDYLVMSGLEAFLAGVALWAANTETID
jgi:hypothetical protein